jgi:hypothetical protein
MRGERTPRHPAPPTQTMKNITIAISDAQYRATRVWAAERDTSISSMVQQLLQNLPTIARAVSAMLAYEIQARGLPPSKEAQALIDIIERPRQNQNPTRRFRGVNKCEPPQSPQSQEVNEPEAESHSIAANVQL